MRTTSAARLGSYVAQPLSVHAPSEQRGPNSTQAERAAALEEGGATHLSSDENPFSTHLFPAESTNQSIRNRR